MSALSKIATLFFISCKVLAPLQRGAFVINFKKIFSKGCPILAPSNVIYSEIQKSGDSDGTIRVPLTQSGKLEHEGG